MVKLESTRLLNPMATEFIPQRKMNNNRQDYRTLFTSNEFYKFLIEYALYNKFIEILNKKTKPEIVSIITIAIDFLKTSNVNLNIKNEYLILFKEYIRCYIDTCSGEQLLKLLLMYNNRYHIAVLDALLKIIRENPNDINTQKIFDFLSKKYDYHKQTFVL